MMKHTLSNNDGEIYADSEIQDAKYSDTDPTAEQVPRNLYDLEQNRSRRWIMITALLEAGLTLTAEQLTRRFSISLRTAYRDIQEIQAMGFPILCDKGRYSLNFKLWDSWIRYQNEAWEAKTKQTNE